MSTSCEGGRLVLAVGLTGFGGSSNRLEIYDGAALVVSRPSAATDGEVYTTDGSIAHQFTVVVRSTAAGGGSSTSQGQKIIQPCARAQSPAAPPVVSTTNPRPPDRGSATTTPQHLVATSASTPVSRPRSTPTATSSGPAVNQSDLTLPRKPIATGAPDRSLDLSDGVFLSFLVLAVIGIALLFGKFVKDTRLGDDT